MRRAAWTAAAGVTILGLAFAAYWFRPWNRWADARVDDALPAVATAPAPSLAPPASSAPASGRPPSGATPQAVLLAPGSFVSHEHSTRGTASIVRQPDGHRVLALADLHTSEGPVVKV